MLDVLSGVKSMQQTKHYFSGALSLSLLAIIHTRTHPAFRAAVEKRGRKTIRCRGMSQIARAAGGEMIKYSIQRETEICIFYTHTLSQHLCSAEYMQGRGFVCPLGVNKNGEQLI
jgi:hypothetical protein